MVGVALGSACSSAAPPLRLPLRPLALLALTVFHAVRRYLPGGL